MFSKFELIPLLRPFCFRRLASMCDFTKNYYIYTSCTDPGTHFCKTSIDGSREHACPKGPHERYIVLPESCPLCCG
ncbi:hypothetical protein FVEG_00867 [Fusarium verticillioides 7600]|uniref:Uncharacterized protein n=6 Tax=Fusarium TaxID=5506 RepID=W7LNP8_GIBM7|nr:hypothetical protein FVEG_00867 [Fusarium verticillioides 7600]XP_018743306.1 hypothetical protein FVEG_00867 [Fusarium verticillioides 7600]EWG37114.1 hypothetical protein FVEG_00867 [Fusarium verticillioides 7600]EWG37115.1 hypothetical protein FVEG_00867 [Fusarium verticillioides 7600]